MGLSEVKEDNNSKIKIKDVPKKKKITVNCTSEGCETSRENTDELMKVGLKEKDFIEEIKTKEKDA